MSKRNKTKRIKKENYVSEEQLELKSFIKILIILIILILGVYFFTKIFVTKDYSNKEEQKENFTSGKINYNTTNIGSMLNKPEKEYYVIMYSSEDLNAVYYNSIASKYSSAENSLKVYYADLSNDLNKKYLSKENVNVNTNNIENFKVDNLALIKVKDNKIVKGISTEEAIKNELNNN